MSDLLVFAFLFFIGSCLGWGIEVVFRKFFSHSNPQHKWINPGFLAGPYLPLYGFGLWGIVFRFVSEQNRDDRDQNGGYCSDTDDNGCRDDGDRVYCRCDIHHGNESQTLGLQP